VAHDHDDASARANAILEERSVVLVKGSRSMQMERVVEAIVAEAGKEDSERTKTVGNKGV
jgi:UDP-N-acetylmuramyl pentapeptide synthase